MTKLLELLFGRLPLGWLQLAHNKPRFIAALAGVAFADVLVLMQLGFMGLMTDATDRLYRALDADIIVSADDFRTLSEGSNVAGHLLVEARGVAGVASVSPLYVGQLQWDRQDGETTVFTLYGVDPQSNILALAGVKRSLGLLELQDVAVMDDRTRSIPKERLASIAPSTPLLFEAAGRTLTTGDTFTLGAGFDSDGYLVVSDQTFFGLLPERASAAPNHLLVRVSPDKHPQAVVDHLRRILPAQGLAVRTLKAARDDEVQYQNIKRPTGIIFGFGVIIGILVGIVIVYQVLASDVADHLAEYATLKAVGYPRTFFLGVVAEQALVLATLGFVPGVLTSMALYALVSSATGLFLEMTVLRASAVLLGTLAMCTISGVIATRRLAAADPADLF